MEVAERLRPEADAVIAKGLDTPHALLLLLETGRAAASGRPVAGANDR